MFGKKKLPQEVYDLFIEAYACSATGEVLDTKAKALYQWLREHEGRLVFHSLMEAVSKRNDEIISQRIKDAEAAEEAEKAKKPAPRKVVVPDDKAEEILRLWNAWFSNDKGHDASLMELYALEKALFAVCPEIQEWGVDVSYDLDVVHGRVVVTEELD